MDIDIAQETFSTSGLMIIARNYLDVYPFDRWSAKVGGGGGGVGVCVCVCVCLCLLLKYTVVCSCVFAAGS